VVLFGLAGMGVSVGWGNVSVVEAVVEVLMVCCWVWLCGRYVTLETAYDVGGRAVGMSMYSVGGSVDR
jgi:hypothetical protein